MSVVRIVGGCLGIALREFAVPSWYNDGVYILDRIPKLVPIEDIPGICEKCKLRYFLGSQVIVIEKGEPVIVLYKTRPGYGHAEYTTDIGKFMDVSIVGIIKR